MDLPEGWVGGDLSALEQQLAREVGRDHVLHGVEVRAVARRHDRDDVVFALPDGRFAEVHLTWAQDRERDPRWPATVIYADREAWKRGTGDY
jgi:hypothetical protein